MVFDILPKDWFFWAIGVLQIFTIGFLVWVFAKIFKFKERRFRTAIIFSVVFFFLEYFLSILFGYLPDIWFADFSLGGVVLLEVLPIFVLFFVLMRWFYKKEKRVLLVSLLVFLAYNFVMVGINIVWDFVYERLIYKALF